MVESIRESAIRGLMLLGRTREEAEQELFKNQDRLDRQMDTDLYRYWDQIGFRK